MRFVIFDAVFSVTHTGRLGNIQQWTVPETGVYSIVAAGAGGDWIPEQRGAIVGGDFELTEGTVLNILCGQVGTGGDTEEDGRFCGGGMTVVAFEDDTPLLVAGGAGGVSNGSLAHPEQAKGGIEESGKAGTSSGSVQDSGGDPGDSGSTGGASCWAQPGAGYYESDTSGCDDEQAESYVDGALGATGANDAEGGFGGGGTGRRDDRIGGGGGYGGGGSGGNDTSDVGGGGGSYNAGENQVAIEGGHAGGGEVRIASYMSQTVSVFGESEELLPNLLVGRDHEVSIGAWQEISLFVPDVFFGVAHVIKRGRSFVEVDEQYAITYIVGSVFPFEEIDESQVSAWKLGPFKSVGGFAAVDVWPVSYQYGPWRSVDAFTDLDNLKYPNLNFKAWWEAPLRPDDQLIFQCILTGKQDGLSDLKLPVSSFQYRLYANGRSGLSVNVPAMSDIADEIVNRINGQLVIRKGVRKYDGAVILSDVARAGDLDVRFNETSQRVAGTISARELLEQPIGGPIKQELKKIESISFERDGSRKIRTETQFGMRPGDKIIAEGSELIINQISVNVTERQNKMDIIAE